MFTGALAAPSTKTTSGAWLAPKDWFTTTWIWYAPAPNGAICWTVISIPDTVTRNRLGVASTDGSRPVTTTWSTSPAAAEAPNAAFESVVTPLMTGGQGSIWRSTGNAAPPADVT